MIKVTENVSYKNFGKTVHITNGVIEANVTTDIGPRIINFSFVGGTNIMFNDTDRGIRNEGPEFEEVFGKGEKWYIYGGHRMWVSPEKTPHSYFPDNYPVEYQLTQTGAVFTQKNQDANGIRQTIEVVMAENKAEMKVIHSVQNTSDSELTLAPWALSVLDKGGVEIIPQNTENTNLLANRVMSIWPYTDMSDPRVFWGEKYITLRQDPNIERAFKIGLDLTLGQTVYVLKDIVFKKQYEHVKGGSYPDYGVSFETYTCKHFIEMESLGELKAINSGETLTHTEDWSLFEKQGDLNERDNESIENFAKKYLG